MSGDAVLAGSKAFTVKLEAFGITTIATLPLRTLCKVKGALLSQLVTLRNNFIHSLLFGWALPIGWHSGLLLIASICLLGICRKIREVWGLVDEILVFQVVHFYRLARDCLTYLETSDDVAGLINDLDSRRNINVVKLERVELYLRAILQMNYAWSVQLRHKTTLALNQLGWILICRLFKTRMNLIVWFSLDKLCLSFSLRLLYMGLTG